jgi:uncharacterized protein (DUF2147 family)
MLIALAAATVLASTAGPTGLWDTPVDRSRVRVAACGPQICGYVVTSTRLTAEPNQADVRNENPTLRSRRIRDLKIMEVGPAEGGEWKGWVYDPGSGHTYKVTVRMKPGDHLEVTGCLVAPLCRSQSWTRAPAG